MLRWEELVMIETYFGMKCNPFRKGFEQKNKYEFTDFKEMQARLEYLLKAKGIGLFTGSSGFGKTYSIKYFVDNLNVGLYKPVYLSLSTITVLDFYKSLCIGLGISPMARKIDMFKQIQDTIKTFVNDRKITPVIILDEAQYLKSDILNDLKMILNFDIDSKNYAVLILMGQPVLNDMLSRNSHEALKQRIVVNYTFVGIDAREVTDYLKNRLRLAGMNENMFEDGAIKAISSICNGSTRKLNSIIENCLMICEQKNENIVTTEIAMLAENELNLI